MKPPHNPAVYEQTKYKHGHKNIISFMATQMYLQ